MCALRNNALGNNYRTLRATHVRKIDEIKWDKYKKHYEREFQRGKVPLKTIPLNYIDGLGKGYAAHSFSKRL